MARAATITTTTVPLRTRTTAPKPKAASNDNFSELEAQMLQLAQDSFLANREANAAKAKADKAKKELDRLMDQNGFKELTLTVDVDGKPVVVEAVYEAGTENVVDVHKLAKKVDQATFMRIVSASQKDVADALGDNVKNQVLVTVEKDPSLKIRAKK